MNLKDRMRAFTSVGMFINRHFGVRLESENQLHAGLERVTELAGQANGWFSPIFVKQALQATASLLNEASLEKLSAGRETGQPKIIALICAGNIPLVGFHDLLCVLLSGHKVLLRLSSDDNILMPFFIRLLTHYEPRFEERIRISEAKLAIFDAVIATGSNNTAKHFDYYFSRYPHIIRRNRSSLAVLSGNESETDLKNLGSDIFSYFGLGCRNVSKLLVPENYDFRALFESIVDYGFVIDNNKYANNYNYYRAIYLLEKQDFLDNNFLMLKQSPHLHSPVATLYYQSYKNTAETLDYLRNHDTEIQCIVGEGYIPFGYSQRPVITDFADRTNTWDFLVSL